MVAVPLFHSLAGTEARKQAKNNPPHLGHACITHTLTRTGQAERPRGKITTRPNAASSSNGLRFHAPPRRRPKCLHRISPQRKEGEATWRKYGVASSPTVSFSLSLSATPPRQWRERLSIALRTAPPPPGRRVPTHGSPWGRPRLRTRLEGVSWGGWENPLGFSIMMNEINIVIIFGLNISWMCPELFNCPFMVIIL